MLFNTGKRFVFILFITLFVSIGLFAETAVILSSGRAEEKDKWEKAETLTVDLYRDYETSLGNTVMEISDYHISRGVDTLYIIAHGWERENEDRKGFVYTDDQNEEHWMAWMSYLAYLDRYTDVKKLVIGSSIAGAAVDAANLLKVSFDFYASCGSDETEQVVFEHPLPYAVAYTSGEIPEEITFLDNTTHPVTYIHTRKDETRPPYL